jgi:photosystem II stability/assembly factor-like uncharacterized protein
MGDDRRLAVRVIGGCHSKGLGRTVVSSALALAGAIGLAACGGSDSPGGAGASAGGSLASVVGDRHVHSLIVDREDPARLLLGVHGGLYVSADAGRTWDLAELEGDDAMNIASAAEGAPLWVAGHEVLERSDDDGATWDPVRPDGLPGLDIHGFAVRPDRPTEIVAAVAGWGLYRSRDGGASFALLSTQVGPSVFGMALTADGALFAADPGQGLLVSADGGRTFRVGIQGQGLVSVAAAPRRPRLVLAGGQPGVVVSRDGGDLWESAFTDAGVAAVAIDPGDPRRAYAVGDDGWLYTTSDAARTWSAVGRGE